MYTTNYNILIVIVIAKKEKKIVIAIAIATYIKWSSSPDELVQQLELQVMIQDVIQN